MAEGLLSINQVARRLDLHPGTVRRFVREGTLRARKVGGQWRVTAGEVARFSGEGAEPGSGEEAGPPALSDVRAAAGEGVGAPEPGGRVRVSAVVDVHGAAQEEAERISTTLLAAMNSGDPELRGARLDFVYYGRERRARFMLRGGAEFVSKIVDMIGELSD